MENKTLNNNPVKNNTSYPGLYIVAITVGFLALVTIVTQFLSVVFDAINIAFPDPLRGSYDYDTDHSSIRLSISSLIVLYPLYLFISYKLAEGVKAYSTLRDSGLRKFVIYASIVITSLTLIGTLISAIYYFLGGEFTMPFFLKSVTVLLTALFVGGYYYTQLNRESLKYTKLPYILGILASVFIIISIVWSIFVIGTPSVMRDRKIDNKRVEDLANIQTELVNYWSKNQALPEELGMIVSSVNYFEMPYDPVTNEMYEYRLIKQSEVTSVPSETEIGKFDKKVSDAVFEICSDFNLRKITEGAFAEESVSLDVGVKGFYASSYDTSYRSPVSKKWDHEMGRHCYTRIISEKFINSY